MINRIRAAETALKKIRDMIPSCRLCPRECGVDRSKGEKGACMCARLPAVFTAMPHMGEEPPVSGTKGSGTIFFSGCGMKCVYCQNHIFSQSISGREVTAAELAEIIIKLERDGCHNINLVSPSFNLEGILQGLILAFSKGMRLPIVYNTGGYESLEVIHHLDGLVDIYLADMRYSSDEMGVKYSGVSGYSGINRRAIVEMYRQTGKLALKDGLAVKGLILRLLVLPGGVSGCIDSLDFIKRELGKDVSISLMSQYYPAYKAGSFDGISRRITEEEYKEIVDASENLGFEDVWIQPLDENFDENLLGENFTPMV